MFSSSEFEEVIPGHDNLMVISAKMVNAEVKRVFIDQGSSANIIFQDTYDKLGLKNSNLQSYKEELVGFSREKVYPYGFVTLYVTLVITLLRSIFWLLIALQHTVSFWEGQL